MKGNEEPSERRNERHSYQSFEKQKKAVIVTSYDRYILLIIKDKRDELNFTRETPIRETRGEQKKIYEIDR